jgi:hypothetical protein
VLVRKGPFCFYFLGGLNAPCFWHASWLPSGGIFLSRDFTHLKIELLTGSATKSGKNHEKFLQRLCWCVSYAYSATLSRSQRLYFVSASAAETMYSE